MRHRIAACATALSLWAGAGNAHENRTSPPVDRPLPLTVHLPETAPPPAWLDEQVHWANRLAAPAGVAFEVVEQRRLPARHARMMTRGDRDALARFRRRGTIDVFVVEHLEDVDEPGRARMGVHWRLRRDRGRRYVILSVSATPTVLAHELGHYFGNGHTDVVDNVMSYRRSDPEQMRFDEVQLARIRREARGLVRRGVLRPPGKRRVPQRAASGGSAGIVGGAEASGRPPAASGTGGATP
jgi:hypothetical protein